MRKRVIFGISIFALALLISGCVTVPPERSVKTYSDELRATKAALADASERGAREECPAAYRAAAMKKNAAVETFWTCRTAEAIVMLMEARKDAEDLCGGEPVEIEVDSDGDGVLDDRDKCPNTPTGVKVDAVGCPLDTDKDGVYDYLDKCPNTPTGVKVDAVGCPLDTDKDGVYDYLDRCPNTPMGATVDARGCWVLKGVHFDTDKWDIKPMYYELLDDVAAILKKNPGLKVEIQGHTDSQGSAKYNQGLSEKRARAVMEDLAGKGIDRSRLSYKGYGLTRPAATNDTPEGRALNRRVELKPIQ
jgi:OOP family OmpA-OmpF porin